MQVVITVNDTSLTIDETTSAAELFRALHPGVEPNAPGYWLLEREDGKRWVENPQRKDSPVIDLFEGGPPVALYLEQPRKCRHGSPEVRNQGFLCGWC